MQEIIDKLLQNKNITMVQLYWLHNLKRIIPILTLEQAIVFTKKLNEMEKEV